VKDKYVTVEDRTLEGRWRWIKKPRWDTQEETD
jgi:hypothetical protein